MLNWSMLLSWTMNTQYPVIYNCLQSNIKGGSVPNLRTLNNPLFMHCISLTDSDLGIVLNLPSFLRPIVVIN